MDSVIEDSVDRQALRESILADGIRILRDLDELDSRLEQEEALTALRRAALQLVQFSGLLLQPPAGLDQLTAFPEPRIKAFLEATDDLQNQLRTLDSQFHAVESKRPAPKFGRWSNSFAAICVAFSMRWSATGALLLKRKRMPTSSPDE